MSETLLSVEGVTKRFGSTLAVDDAAFRLARGELIGIAGHNGAGKSTVLNVVTGRLAGDAGTVTLDGTTRDATVPVASADALGIRIVFQELSLCPALRVDETAAVFDRSARGTSWRTAAWNHLQTVLDEMFPGHGIRRQQQIRDLSIARRQMIECAAAMLPGEVPAKLVILDEPTSSLDASSTESFYAYLHRRAAEGLSAIVTTHRLHEMIDNLSRLYIMRDGRIVSEEVAATSTKESLVAAMGIGGHEAARERTVSDVERPPVPGDAPVRVHIGDRATGAEIELRAGEIIGLGGLEGHGQVAVLEALAKAARSRLPGPKRTLRQDVTVDGTVAYVSGDRGDRGIFRYWDVGQNVTIANLKRLSTAGFLSRGAERRLVDGWWPKLGIKGGPEDPIVSLSGGTQQKALMARAMAEDSDLLLLEDPTRGVDQSTKEDVYALLRRQAAEGQCVVWYSTENEELRHCDRVLVFRSNEIVAVLAGSEATEDAILSSSFAGAPSSLSGAS
ncbi:sugar ABC transporter ATP-binding protein [Pseudonocardia sp. RS11V-5]|uniref:ATP-binding cassette domain-containing protein n=1 Tax=Pseudonocardia terrae TaxID=2905831 RepID=UPI001E2C943A|nr:sugar ABC transporter ATP-binding protein [Pseudonocardia terrae]MCE3551411.1 sugar ABC transporter ATP-binding protein [Pseudonocardia terrae]